MRLGRFLILAGMPGAISGLPVTMTSSAFGMALLADNDLSIGCAPVIERFFLPEDDWKLGNVDDGEENWCFLSDRVLV